MPESKPNSQPAPAKPALVPAKSTRSLAWQHRLYLRIYLAVLASLLLAAVIFAWLAYRHTEQPRFGPGLETFAEIAANALPPASAAPKVQQEAMTLLQVRVHANLGLFTSDGQLIASVGSALPTLPAWNPQTAVSAWYPAHPPVFALKLPDGRWLLGQHVRAPFGPSARLSHERREHESGFRGPPPPARGLLTILLVAAFSIALGAYPVVRRLTRRLEHLQQSVDTWGNGQLSTRFAVEGKDEVASLAESFNQAAARIESLMQAQKNLLANASHELRSPLARIRMALELAASGVKSAPGQHDMQEELRRNIHELDQLIDEILLTSRLDASQVSIASREPIDCIGLLAEECARVGAQLDVDNLPDHEVLLLGEPKLVRRMLRNLLENARRYGALTTDGESDIVAQMRQCDGMLEIDICDRGPGVPEAEREQIFAPFYRLAGARESEGGVGLGLALVRQIAERHHGQVQCLARAGGGSCFRLRLPFDGGAG